MTAAARPLTVASEAAVAVRDALLAAREPLRIVGRGTWLEAGRPVRATSRLDMTAHSGLVEYEPGDLTLTAKAGTTLAEIQAATRPHGQWLGLDPHGGDAGSIGATVATASYGPLAHAFGTPRDNVLGVEFVDGAGRVARGGGRVVKNVAGYDLTRLQTGAWGTLGIVTEVTVRLRSLPERMTTVILPAPEREGQLAALLGRLRAAPIAPLALELVGASLARLAEIAPHSVIVALLGGNDEHVTGQVRALAAFGDLRCEECGTILIDRLGSAAERNLGEPRTAEVRLSARPSDLASLWTRACGVAERLGGSLVRAHVGRGVVRLTTSAGPERLREVLENGRWGGTSAEGAGPTAIFETLPHSLWPTLAPSPAVDRISRGIRDAFDPHRRLNPGILGE